MLSFFVTMRPVILPTVNEFHESSTVLRRASVKRRCFVTMHKFYYFIIGALFGAAVASVVLFKIWIAFLENLSI